MIDPYRKKIRCFACASCGLPCLSKNAVICTCSDLSKEKHQLVHAKQMFAACGSGVDGARHSTEEIFDEDATNNNHLTRFL